MTKKGYKKFYRDKDSGMAAVESIFLMSLMLFLFMYFIAFGFLMYQGWVVQNVADDAATKIAQGYVYPQTDPVMNFFDRNMRRAVSPFRYIFYKNDLADENAEKGEAYVRWCLKNSTLAKTAAEPEIEVRTVHDGLAQRHIEVKITATYQIPMGGFLEYFGGHRNMTYSTVGRAVCVDPSDYIYSVNTVTAIASDVAGAGSVIKMVDSVFTTIVHIIQFFKE